VCKKLCLYEENIREIMNIIPILLSKSFDKEKGGGGVLRAGKISS